MEDIEANNRQVNSVLDTESGDMVFKVLMKSFEFEKALMQEHFNENYVESDTYPNALFKGKVVNLEEIDFTESGKYDAILEGELTIKGITQPVKENGTFEILEEGTIHGHSVFNIRLADYEIKIPSAVVDNIAEVIEITVDIKLDPYKK
jgi:polyisoprenoid-binding protein YceI